MSQLKDTELRRFLNSLTDWVWEMDVHGIHTYSNNAVETILGYKAEELIGRHVSMFWPEKLATAEKIEQFNTELKDGIPWQHFRGQFRHKNGDLKILESSGEPLFDEHGLLIGFRGMDRDIAISLKHEQELEESREQYKILSEQLDWENNFKALLLDIINHDIMNPISVITGLSDILKDKLPENEMVQTINTSSRRLIEVMSNARALTQISLQDSIDRRELKLSQIIRSVLQEFEKVFLEKSIDIEVSIPEDMHIHANPVVVEVFNNYISNVLKHAVDSHLVKITAENTAEFTIVEVKDQGQTLPEDVRSAVFARGVQLDQARTGGGLGLAIVKRIAQAHGAEVGVRPRASGGNSFYIKFPR